MTPAEPLANPNRLRLLTEPLPAPRFTDARRATRLTDSGVSDHDRR